MRILSPVVLPGDPTVALAPGTKQYIDAGLALKLDATATPSLPPPGPSPASIMNIGVKLGQNHFSAQLARLGDAAFFVKTTTDIAGGYEETPLFYGADALKTWVAYRVQVGAPTTSGSTFARAEGREQGENNLDYGFDATDANTHYIQGRFRIVHAPAVVPDMVCVQLHNGSADRISIRTQLVSGTWRLRIRFNGSTVTLDAGGTDVAVGIANIQGLDWDYKIQTVNGLPTVWLGLATDPNTLTTAKYTGSTNFTSTGSASWYHKYGCYLQTTTANDTSTDYGEVWHYGSRLQHWHTGWTTPAPFYAVAKHSPTHLPGSYDDLSGNYLTLGTTQTVVGSKTFTAAPTVPATSAPGHALGRSESDDKGIFSFRMSRWGLLAATFHPMHNTATGSYATAPANAISLARVFIPAGVAINNITAMVGTAGAGASNGGQNGFAVYEISGTTATLVSTSANDATLWTATGWAKKTLSTPVAAQGTDREVLLGVAMSMATTMPAVMVTTMRNSSFFNTKVSDGSVTGMCYYLTQTTWPSTFTLGSTSIDFFYPFLGVY